MPTIKLSAEAHTRLSSWAGRLQRLQGSRVTLSDGLLEALKITDTLSDTELTTLSNKEFRERRIWISYNKHKKRLES